MASSHLHQPFLHIMVTLTDCIVQWCEFFIVFLVGVKFGLHQILHHLQSAKQGTNVESCAALIIYSIKIPAILLQQLNHCQMAISTGRMDGGAASMASNGGWSDRDQSTNTANVPKKCSMVEGCKVCNTKRRNTPSTLTFNITTQILKVHHSHLHHHLLYFHPYCISPIFSLPHSTSASVIFPNIPQILQLHNGTSPY